MLYLSIYFSCTTISHHYISKKLINKSNKTMAEVDINGRRIRRKARVRWTDESVKFLLHLWKSAFSEMQTAKTKWPLYINMAKKMSQRGYHFNATEIKFKIHNLTNRYRAERKKLRTYNIPESDWDVYKPLDYLLGDDETYEWESPNEDYEDPLDDIQDSADKGMEGEDNFMKIELEDGHIQNEPKVEVEVDANQMSLTFSSSESENECVSKSEDRVTKPNPGEQSRFRIIADRIKPSTNNSNSYKVNTSRVTNAGRTSFIPERFSKQLTAEKSNAQTLNLARLELIQLQKDNALKEMEYRRQEFEQKTEEHNLRLKHMEEEHQLRMQSLRNQPTLNENKFYESL